MKNYSLYIITLLLGLLFLQATYIYQAVRHDSTLTGEGTDSSPLGLVAVTTANGGMLTGGTTGQVLKKNSNSNYDLVWATGGGDALVANPLSQFASTTSSQLAGVISDETGTDKLVYSASPALTGTPTATTATLNTNSTQIATTAYVDGKIFTTSLGTDHTSGSTLASPVSCSATGVPTGTYVFQYYILAQSGTAGTSPMFGINFTGTASVKAFRLRYPDTGTTATSGTADDDGSLTGQIEGSDEETAFTTTNPNMGATGGVATTGANILYIIEGILVVTASGNLELYHGSETNNNTIVKAGTSLILTKTN